MSNDSEKAKQENDDEYDEALNQVLSALRAEYLQEIPSRMNDLRSHIKNAKAQPENPHQWLVEAHTVAHRLAGTAGSYGFPELSQKAAALDAHLKQVLNIKGEATIIPAAEIDWQAIDSMAQAMSESVPSSG